MDATEGSGEGKRKSGFDKGALSNKKVWGGGGQRKLDMADVGQRVLERTEKSRFDKGVRSNKEV